MPSKPALFAFDSGIDSDHLVAACRSWGIDELILPPAFDLEGETGRAMERGGVKLWLNLPVFFNPARLEERPGDHAVTNRGRPAVRDWCRFVCPTTPGYVDDLAERWRDLAARLHPERISLDFIRHFVFWERVSLDGSPEEIEDGCWCPRCRAMFERDTGLRVPETAPRGPAVGPLRDAWGKWKTDLISRTAKRLFDAIREGCPDARLLVKLVPWREDELGNAIRVSAGQDRAALARLVDATVPMTFSHVLGRDEAWKTAHQNDLRATTGKPTASYVQCAALFDMPPIPLERVEAELRAAVAGDWEAVPVFCFEQLAAAPEVAATVRRVLLDLTPSPASAPAR